MLTLLSKWVLIATLGQAPADAALLKVAPAEVDVAVRVRGLEGTRDDLLAMLKEMNPDWANMAEGALKDPLDQIRTHHGALAVKSPFLGLVRLGDDAAGGGPPPFAVLLPSDDYKGILKEFLGGQDVELKHQDGDFDAFDGPGGSGTWYAAKAPGVVAFGTSKGLIADFAKRGGKTLDTVLTGPSAKPFNAGDVGIYVNAASLTKRFADQIDQGRQMLMGALDQAGQQAGNPGTMQMAKDMYAGLFDSLKYADGVTIALDFAGTGLQLSGFLTLKPDSEMAKAVAEVRTGDIATLGRLPQGAMVYSYMNVSAKTFDRLQAMNLRTLAGAGKPSAELEKALADLHAMGRLESVGAVTMDKGMVTITDVKTTDSKKFLDNKLAVLRAMGGGEGQSGLFKDIKIEPAAQTLHGMTFTHASANINFEKLAEMSGNNPAQVEAMKAMFGEGSMNTWYGTDGQRTLDVLAPTWDAARPLIETYLKGEGGAGQSAGFKAVLSELPARDNFAMLFSLQGVVKMWVNLFSAMTKNPNLKMPEDMPKEPAYVGASLTPHPSEGYEFHFVVPSAVGAVVAKGVIPLFQAIGAGGANP
jgi:hypothetical protein